MKHGDKQIYINSLAKAMLFQFQTEERFHLNIFKNEEPLENYIEYLTSKRIENYYQNKEMYDYFLKNALQRKFDTHPSFKMRMEALDVSDFVIDFNFKRTEEYEKELHAINLVFNRIWYEKTVTVWDKNREYYYLYYLKKYENLKNRDYDTLLDEEKISLACASYELNNIEEALRICNDILERNPNNSFVLFNRALIKFRKNDLSCIDDFDRVSDINHDKAVEAYDYIGLILNNNGKEDMMNDYRKKHLEKVGIFINNVKYQKAEKGICIMTMI